MNFTFKLLSGTLAVVLVMLSLAGYGASKPVVVPPVDTDEAKKIVENVEMSGFTDYDTELIKFMSEKKSRKNFSVSPLSIKYAMGMATAGAVGDTQRELVDASGMGSVEAYGSWAKDYLAFVKDSNEYWADSLDALKKYTQTSLGAEEFRIANSLWKIKQSESDKAVFAPKYIEDMSECYNGEVEVALVKDAAAKINQWVSDNTNEKIKTIIQDVSPDLVSVLVNTVYLKLNWDEEFDEAVEMKDWFTDINGNKQTKEVMRKQDFVHYYEDKNCQMVSLNLGGAIKMAFVLGDSNKSIKEMLAKAKSEKVIISIPKFTIESEFSNGEIKDFYASRGVDEAFSDNADFSAMFDNAKDDFCISNIVHKTYVECQEKGIEAAAATAIMMETCGVEIEKPVEEPKIFEANKPFAFYIYSSRYDKNNPDADICDLIFYGQYVA